MGCSLPMSSRSATAFAVTLLNLRAQRYRASQTTSTRSSLTSVSSTPSTLEDATSRWLVTQAVLHPVPFTQSSAPTTTTLLQCAAVMTMEGASLQTARHWTTMLLNCTALQMGTD